MTFGGTQRESNCGCCQLVFDFASENPGDKSSSSESLPNMDGATDRAKPSNRGSSTIGSNSKISLISEFVETFLLFFVAVEFLLTAFVAFFAMLIPIGGR
jgi:hypothetical protein